MSDYVSLGDLENDPQYIKADASTQAAAREIWLQQYGGSTPGYAEADPLAKLDFMEQVRTRAPKLEQDDARAREWIDVADRAAQGDQQAIDRARQIHTENMIAESGGLVGWLGTKLAAALGNEDFQAADTETDRRDRAKAFEYFQAKTSANDRVMDWTMTAQNLGISGAGLITDLLLFKGAGSLLAKGAVAFAGESSVIGRAAANISAWAGSAATRAELLQTANVGRATQFLLGDALPQLAGAAADGAMLTGTQLLRSQEAEKIYGTLSPQASKQALQLFGENFFMDMAAWSVFRAIKPVALWGKTVVSKVSGTKGMTNEEVAQMVTDISEGRDVAPDLMSKLAAENPTQFERIWTIRNQKIKGATNFDVGTPQFAEAFAARSGYTLGQNPDGLVAVFSDETGDLIGHFNTHAEALDGLTDHLIKLDKLTKDAPISNLTFKPDDIATIEHSVVGHVTESATPTQIQYLTHAFYPNAMGKLDIKPFQAVDAAWPNTKPFKMVDEQTFMQAGGQSDEFVLVPATTLNQRTKDILASTTLPQVEFKLNQIGDQKLGTMFIANKKRLDDLLVDTYSSKWVSEEAQKLGIAVGQTPQGVRLDLPDGTSRIFTRPDAAATFIMNQSGGLTEAQFAQVLRRDHSLSLEKAPDGTMQLRQMWGDDKLQAGGIVATGKDIADLLEQKPELRPRLPSRAAPYMMVLDPSGKFQINGNVVTGDWQTLSQMTDKFFWDAAKQGENPGIREAVVRTMGDNQLAYNLDKAVYKVTIPKYNITLNFSSLDEAQAVLKRSVQSYADLEKVALMKGLVVDTRGKTMYMRTIGKDEITQFNTLDEAAAYLKSLPDVPGESLEMSGMFNSLEEIVKTPELKELLSANAVQNGRPMTHDWQFESAIADHRYKGKSQPIRDFFGRIIDGMDSQFRKLATTKDDMRFYEIYRLISTAHTRYKGKANNIDALVNGVTRNLSVEDRRSLIDMFAHEPAEWPAAWKAKTGRDWNQNLEAAMVNSKALLDGHATMFGIDPWITLKNYFPRFRAALKEASEHEGYDPNASTAEFLQKHGFGDSLPKELRFFSENMRMKDFASFSESATFDEVIARYLNRGYKKLVMDDAMKQTEDIFRALCNEGKVSVHESRFIHDFRETAYGMSQTSGENAIQEATDKFAYGVRDWMNKIRGKSDKGVNLAHKDAVDFMKSLTVASTMSFRPGLVMRNLQQIYQTLTPLMGFDWVDAAMDELGKQGTWKVLKAAIEESRTKGHLMGAISPLGELESNKGFIDHFNKWGMKPYQDSDVATRLIVDKSVAMAWKQPAERLLASSRTTEDFQRFLRDTRLDGLDPVHQRTIMEAFGRHGSEAGLAEAQRHVQNYTMFSYQKFDNPLSGKGLIGKIFGMFGHYPQHYASMVKTMITNPNKARAAQMVYSTAVTAAAFYVVGEQMLGISSRNFMPWNQALFTGGPYWDYINTLTTASDEWTGRSTPQSKLAATQLPRQTFQLMTPFGMNLNAMANKVPKLLSEGDVYGAGLTLLALPYVSDADIKR